MGRTAEVARKTGETDIQIRIDLDGTGASAIDTGVGFFDHMLTALSRHSLIDMDIAVKGDTWVDDHHTVEDTGIALGQAIAQALGDKRGIRRYGDVTLPMDEALVLCAVDLSGRSCLRCALSIPTEKVGTFDTELVAEFLAAFAREAALTLHVRQLDGTNSHHIIEAVFKALARALRAAAAIDPAAAGAVPSTKGLL